ncbi:MAG: NADH-quinone oxidoreductase subunit M, partial [Nitrosomonas sp.]|nr:NADH-quinone oxidoreductase subunit M [Nitrosomonas sp.]
MIEADFPLLSLTMIVPLLGAILAGSIRNIDFSKQVAFFIAVLSLLLTICVLILLDANKGEFQLVERYSWISILNIEYLIGVD